MVNFLTLYLEMYKESHLVLMLELRFPSLDGYFDGSNYGKLY